MSLIYSFISQEGIITRNKVDIAIDRLRAFQPEEGYYLAFSGGKDSQCIYHLAKEGNIKFDAHYNLTSVDPPELVHFIKSNYPDVIIKYPEQSMFKLIQKNGLPTRLQRWCCRILKEGGGENRICVTGVRKAESNARSKRQPFEVIGNKRENSMLFNDNTDDRKLFENCVIKGKRIVNPIIDWEDEDVWEYIRSRNIQYCKLYDEGFTRLGCIGCPMAGNMRKKEFDRWNTFEHAYKKSAKIYLEKYNNNKLAKGDFLRWSNVEELWAWWLEEKSQEYDENQIEINDETEEM
jgi:phosphoadenosine phosphosulfate reductase